MRELFVVIGRALDVDLLVGSYGNSICHVEESQTLI
jgi:hypothetical protein